METNTNNGVHVQNGTAKATINKAAQNGAAKQEQGTSPAKENASGRPEAEKPNPEPAKGAAPEPPKPGQPESEELRFDIRAAEERPALTLEAKLKTVDTLHRKSVQRLNLIARLKQLEAFEVALAQESDELEDNPYQGCKLIIEDDKGRRFITTTPGLIRLTSQFIFNACEAKRAEIEAEIVFPNA